MSAREIVIKTGKTGSGSNQNDGEPNTRGERCHENLCKVSLVICPDLSKSTGQIVSSNPLSRSPSGSCTCPPVSARGHTDAVLKI